MNGILCDNYLDLSANYSNGYSNGSTSKDYATILASSSSINSSPLNSGCLPSSSSGLGYIEHRVSRMDTLAGVAIKYGVEVADIRRMNGLVTDLQMFALDTLRIPLPGRHPPSSTLSNGTTDNGYYQTPSRRPHDDILSSLQSLKLKPPRKVSKTPPKPKNFHLIGETKMSTYKTNKSPSSEEEDAKSTALNKHRKSRSLVSLENIQDNGDSTDNDTSVRRRQKCDAMDSSAPEVIIKDESNDKGFLGRIGKGLALRPKLGARADSSSSTPIGDFFNDVFVAMRKSSSTSSLQESEGGSGSLFAWSMSISRPVFDGLPNAVSGRKNKAALD